MDSALHGFAGMAAACVLPRTITAWRRALPMRRLEDSSTLRAHPIRLSPKIHHRRTRNASTGACCRSSSSSRPSSSSCVAPARAWRPPRPATARRRPSHCAAAPRRLRRSSPATASSSRSSRPASSTSCEQRGEGEREWWQKTKEAGGGHRPASLLGKRQLAWCASVAAQHSKPVHNTA